jgi:hypothetical protein
MAGLHIDCTTCAARDLACEDCVVSTLLGPMVPVEFSQDERDALTVLADSGLVPPLRHVPARSEPPPLRLIPGARPGQGIEPRRQWEEFG